MKKTPNPNCEFCEGTGEIVTPAYQRGGDVVDEHTRDCVCLEQENIEEAMDDDSDFDDLGRKDEFGIDNGLPDDF